MVDLPKDVVSQEWNENFRTELDLPGYKVQTSGNSKNIKKISELLKKSKLKLIDTKGLVNKSEIIFVTIQTPHNKKYEGVTRIPNKRID